MIEISSTLRNQLINQKTKELIDCYFFNVIDFFDVISIENELIIKFFMISNAI